MKRFFEKQRASDREEVLSALRALGGEAKMGKLCGKLLLSNVRVKELLKDLIDQGLVETAGNHPQVVYKLKEK